MFQETQLIIGTLGGFFAGIAYADFVVTWKLHRHLSIDAFYLVGLSGFCALALYTLPN